MRRANLNSSAHSSDSRNGEHGRGRPSSGASSGRTAAARSNRPPHLWTRWTSRECRDRWTGSWPTSSALIPRRASSGSRGRVVCEGRRARTGLREGLQTDAIEPHRLVKALQFRQAVVLEGKPLTKADLADGARNQDAAGKTMRAQAGRQLDRGTEEITLLRHRLPTADPDPEPKRVGGVAVALGDPALDFDGAVQGVRDRGEGGHDAIAGMLDLEPAMR